MPRPLAFSERKSSSMMTTGKRNFMRSRLLVRPKMERGAGPGPGPTPVGTVECAPGLCAEREAGASPLTPPAAGSAARLGAHAATASAVLDVGDDQRPGPGEQADAQRCPEPPPPRQVLLRGHHGGEREHPSDAADADDEHHQHQGPAA